MTRRRHYPKPPITEAVIEIKSRLPQESSVALLEKVGTVVSADYPTKEPLTQVSGQIIGEGGSANAAIQSAPHGYRFWNTNRQRMFQARLGSFSCHHLAPYQQWETFRAEAKRLWEVYEEMTNPEEIIGLGVRYINRLDFPMNSDGSLDLEDYLTVLPRIPMEVSSVIAKSFMQLVFPQPEFGGTVVLNQATVDSPRPDVISVALDIEVQWGKKITNKAELWDMLDLLHTREVEIFEACINDATRELFR